MLLATRGGHSLVELIVALLLLEVIGGAALATAFTAERIGRHAAAGAVTDMARWQGYRGAELDSTCVEAAAPDTQPLAFAATAERPPLRLTARCGR